MAGSGAFVSPEVRAPAQAFSGESNRDTRLGVGMERPARSAYMDIVEQRTLDDSSYRVTIAANEQARQSPELDITGLSTENYERNPVAMWAHDAVCRPPSGGLPIGRTSKLIKSADGRIVADFEFLTEDPFSQRVKNAWDKGFPRAASISWLPLEGGLRRTESGGTRAPSFSNGQSWPSPPTRTPSGSHIAA